MADSQSHSTQPPIQQLQTVTSLLETPTIARLYIYVLQHGPATVAEIAKELQIKQGTAGDFVQNLKTTNLLNRINEQRPYQYDAESVELMLSTEQGTRTITPALIAAVARASEDENIEAYIKRNGLDDLAVALTYAYEYTDASVNHQIAAQELDLSPLEAEIILQALEPIAVEYTDMIV